MNRDINTEIVEEVALAVENQDEAASLFEELFGLDFKESWNVPEDNMKVKCARVGDTQFHLLASTSPDAVIAKYIRDRGEGIHHIAFRVSDLDKVIARLKEKGIKLIPDQPRAGTSIRGESVRYIFIHPKSVHGVLIEVKGK